MHRLAVSICANSLLVLLACAPETAPAPKSSAKSQSTTSSATQTTPASNTQVNNATPPAMDPPFVMRTSTGNAAQAGASAAMRTAQGSAGQAAASTAGAAGAPPARAGAAGAAGAASSQAGAGAPSAGNTECVALATCCAALTDEDDREDCQEVAERNDAERCMRASEAACQSQGTPTTPTTQGEACMKLSTCCGTLPRPPQQADCLQDAMRADDERCTRQLQRICPELGPPPREPACVTLQACCPMLKDRPLDLCRRALQEDEQRDCTQASMQLCQ
jgi:hypothetical protein